MDARHSCKESVVTGINYMEEFEFITTSLNSQEWRQILDGVTSAISWMQSLAPGDARVPAIIERLVALANHPKWEVRRAVAHVAAKTLHGDFEPIVARLITDDNARVRYAAKSAALRRRDWANASALGKQHEGHIKATFDDIEARFGTRGRATIKRASEHIANTFAREVYHEVIKLISPLATSADRFVLQANDENVSRTKLVDEASRMKSRIARLRSILEAMRAYTAQHKVTFTMESLKEVVEESVALSRDSRREIPLITIKASPIIHAEVCRVRMVQALTNLLANAIESYDGLETTAPIVVAVHAEENRIMITIEDRGCGMSDEVLTDATVLFSTSKPNGTGFGLPLVVKIIESEHEGRLNLESRKGYGTIAKIVIPVRHQRQ